MNKIISNMGSKFSALSSREKWMLIILAWGGLLFLTYTFLIEPAMVSSQSNKAKIATLNTKLQQNRNKLASLTVQLNQDPDKELDLKLSRLMNESQQLSKKMSEVVEGLVSPSAMAGLLEQVLDESHKLKLISLESMPLEIISIDTQNPDEILDIGYYIHPVKIVVSGGYFDIQQYLATLEAMPVKYYWRSFDYEVDEFPTAKLELVVYTLGERQEFIGG